MTVSTDESVILDAQNIETIPTRNKRGFKPVVKSMFKKGKKTGQCENRYKSRIYYTRRSESSEM